MGIVLQIWGGASYLINKILFSLAENKEHHIKRKMKMFSWSIYITGVPAWVIILMGDQNWIAASIEAGGIPSMLLGLYTVYKNSEKPNQILDRIASFFTYASIALGAGYSLFDNGGIRSFSQILEMGVMLGFLLGSYLLAKSNRTGWLFFMLMNGSMAALMLIQQKPLLSIQQLISLSFVIYGYISSNRNSGKTERLCREN
jgi:hypothetical protein